MWVTFSAYIDQGGHLSFFCLQVVKVPLWTIVSLFSTITLLPFSLGLFSLFPNNLSSKSIKTSEPKNLLLLRSINAKFKKYWLLELSYKAKFLTFRWLFIKLILNFFAKKTLLFKSLILVSLSDETSKRFRS